MKILLPELVVSQIFWVVLKRIVKSYFPELLKWGLI